MTRKTNAVDEMDNYQFISFTTAFVLISFINCIRLSCHQHYQFHQLHSSFLSSTLSVSSTASSFLSSTLSVSSTAFVFLVINIISFINCIRLSCHQHYQFHQLHSSFLSSTLSVSSTAFVFLVINIISFINCIRLSCHQHYQFHQLHSSFLSSTLSVSSTAFVFLVINIISFIYCIRLSCHQHYQFHQLHSSFLSSTLSVSSAAFIFLVINIISFINHSHPTLPPDVTQTASLASWLRCPPQERNIRGSIPTCTVKIFFQFESCQSHARVIAFCVEISK